MVRPVRLGSARPCTPLIVQSILSKHKDVQNIKKSALASLTSLCNSELERAARVKALGQVLEDGAASELFHQYISDLRDDQALKMMDVLQTVSRLLAFVARQID
jgi:ribosome assembly protein YihI (activator of Der GTPase)